MRPFKGWTEKDLLDRGYADVVHKHAKSVGKSGRPLQDESTRVAATSPLGIYKTKLELAYGQYLEILKKTGAIQDYFYEPFSFRLATGKRYRVDFLIWQFNGTTDCIEVKGWHANRRDSLTHLAWAAQKYRFHRWLLVTRNRGGGGWDEQHIPA